MKRTLPIMLALMICAVFVASAFAQNGTAKQSTVAPSKTTAPSKKPVVERKPTAKKGAKPKAHHYSGEVTNMDTMSKMMAVKGSKDEMTFDVGTARMKGWVREGDKVTVTYTEKEGKMMASSVTKGPTKKETKPGAKPIKAAPATK